MRMRCVCRNTGIIHRTYFQWRIFRIETKKNQFNRMKCMKFGNLHNYICGKCCLNAFLFIKWNSLSMESIEISKEFFLFCIVLKITRFENCWHRNKDIFHWRWEETKKKNITKNRANTIKQNAYYVRWVVVTFFVCSFFFIHIIRTRFTDRTRRKCEKGRKTENECSNAAVLMCMILL